MRKLLFAAMLLIAGIAGAGFYRGWFQYSSDSSDHKSNATITMDKDKILADEQKGKEKMKDFGRELKKTGGDR